MLEPTNNDELPTIPGKRYFAIGEVSELCAVKPHVLRYWEQEFPQLKPVKRRGNRRYYQRQDVMMIREIRELLYDQGFTIGGARQKLDSAADEPKPAEATTNDQLFPDLIDKMINELESVLTLLKTS
jgi:DNA-binding transcriptional MerR regulator